MLAFFGYLSNYSLRVNLSVAIVKMTENRTFTYENGTIGYVHYLTHEKHKRANFNVEFFLGTRL